MSKNAMYIIIAAVAVIVIAAAAVVLMNNGGQDDKAITVDDFVGSYTFVDGDTAALTDDGVKWTTNDKKMDITIRKASETLVYGTWGQSGFVGTLVGGKIDASLHSDYPFDGTFSLMLSGNMLLVDGLGYTPECIVMAYSCELVRDGTEPTQASVEKSAFQPGGSFDATTGTSYDGVSPVEFDDEVTMKIDKRVRGIVEISMERDGDVTKMIGISKTPAIVESVCEYSVLHRLVADGSTVLMSCFDDYELTERTFGPGKTYNVPNITGLMFEGIAERADVTGALQEMQVRMAFGVQDGTFIDVVTPYGVSLGEIMLKDGGLVVRTSFDLPNMEGPSYNVSYISIPADLGSAHMDSFLYRDNGRIVASCADMEPIGSDYYTGVYITEEYQVEDPDDLRTTYELPEGDYIAIWNADGGIIDLSWNGENILGGCTGDAVFFTSASELFGIVERLNARGLMIEGGLLLKYVSEVKFDGEFRYALSGNMMYSKLDNSGSPDGTYDKVQRDFVMHFEGGEILHSFGGYVNVDGSISDVDSDFTVEVIDAGEGLYVMDVTDSDRGTMRMYGHNFGTAAIKLIGFDGSSLRTMIIDVHEDFVCISNDGYDPETGESRVLVMRMSDDGQPREIPAFPDISGPYAGTSETYFSDPDGKVISSYDGPSIVNITKCNSTTVLLETDGADPVVAHIILIDGKAGITFSEMYTEDGVLLVYDAYGFFSEDGTTLTIIKTWASAGCYKFVSVGHYSIVSNY